MNLNTRPTPIQHHDLITINKNFEVKDRDYKTYKVFFIIRHQGLTINPLFNPIWL